MFFIPCLRRHTWISDSLALFILVIIFYSIWLGHYPVFTPDEGRYSEIAREMVVSGDYVTPRVNGIAFLDKPILYYWLQALSIRLFGVQEWALRFFPMILGVIGCLAAYLSGRHLFTRRAGLLAASILATTPLYFGGAHYADLNLEVAVFISCSLLCFINAMQSHLILRNILLFAAYTFAALACLTKGLIGLTFPALIICAWMILLRRWKLLTQIHLIKGLILFLTIVLPWYILVHQANPTFLHYFFITQQVTRFMSNAVFNNPSPIWFYIPIILIGFFPWSIFLLQAIYQSIRNTWQASNKHPAELFFLLWAGIIFIFFSIPHSKTIGYILPIFPALALLVGHYLDGIWTNAQQKNGVAKILLIILSLSIASILFALPHYQWLDFSIHLNIYLRIMGSLILIACILTLLKTKYTSLRSIFFILLSTNILFLLTLTHGAKYLNLSSAKSLAVELKKIIQPQDEVVAYYKYYQDVPLYLGQRINIVANWNAHDISERDNWVREFWFGISFQNASEWLINDDIFWQRWESDKRLFVFLNQNYFSQFKEKADNYFVIGKSNDILLLSNRLGE